VSLGKTVNTFKFTMHVCLRNFVLYIFSRRLHPTYYPRLPCLPTTPTKQNTTNTPRAAPVRVDHQETGFCHRCSGRHWSEVANSVHRRESTHHRDKRGARETGGRPEEAAFFFIQLGLSLSLRCLHDACRNLLLQCAHQCCCSVWSRYGRV